MQRREFIRYVCSGLAVGSLDARSSANTAPTESNDSFSFLTKPYLQNPTPTSVTVRWIANRPCDSWVEFGTTAALGQKSCGCVDGLKTCGHIQNVKLAGLLPGRKYFYRVVSRQITKHQAYNVEFGPALASQIYSFNTFEIAPKSVRFTVFNDIHQDIELWKKLARHTADFAPDFSVLNGDIMHHIDDEQNLIEKIAAPAAEIFAGSIPFYFVRGNHETRGAYARELNRYLSFPKDRYYFAKTIGPIRFLALDSGEDKADASKEYFGLTDFDRYRSVQQEWLRSEIASPEFQNAAFRIVVQHMPALPNPRWQGTNDCFQKWSPFFAQGKVDLFICGHTHRYKIIPPSEAEKRPYPMAIGGGPKPGEGTVMTVEANENELLLNMIGEEGKVVEKQQITQKM